MSIMPFRACPCARSYVKMTARKYPTRKQTLAAVESAGSRGPLCVSPWKLVVTEQGPVRQHICLMCDHRHMNIVVQIFSGEVYHSDIYISGYIVSAKVLFHQHKEHRRRYVVFDLARLDSSLPLKWWQTGSLAQPGLNSSPSWLPSGRMTFLLMLEMQCHSSAVSSIIAWMCIF